MAEADQVGSVVLFLRHLRLLVQHGLVFPVDHLWSGYPQLPEKNMIDEQAATDLFVQFLFN